MDSTSHIDVEQVKRAAAGHWMEILSTLGGLPREVLDGKHHPCPKCGGTDRFSAFKDFADTGAVLCRKCFATNNGDGLAAIQWATGASFPDVLNQLADRVGITSNGTGRSNRHTGHQAPTAKEPVKTFATVADALAVYETKMGSPSTWYEYTDTTGQCVAIVYRWNSAGGKEIRPISRIGDGWGCCGMPEPRLLYNLPRLSDAERIYVCEGEKAADAIIDLGLTATTSTNGAKSAHKSDWRPLAGKSVVVLPDSDSDGEHYATSVVDLLSQLVPQPIVRVLRLPGLGHADDAFDYVAQRKANGASRDEIRAEIERAATETTPEATSKRSESSAPTAEAKVNGACSLHTRCYEGIEMESVRWLWRDRFALGKLSLLAGVPGVGKTFLLCDIAARCSTGGIFPDGTNAPQCGVLILTAEDAPEDTIKPRLTAHNADCSRIHHVDHVAAGKREDYFSLTSYLDVLGTWLDAHRDVKLVIFDPITAFMGDRVDSHKNAEVRAVLGPLCKLAETHDVCVLGNTHFSKSQTKAINRVIGSIAFVGAARACWLVDWDPEEDGRRLFLPIKNNLGHADGLAYTITDGRIEWEPGAVTITADDLSGDGTHTTPREEAEDWLKQSLQGGRVQSSKLMAEAKREGISERTLKRAKKALHVMSDKDGAGWYWSLPSEPVATGGSKYDFEPYNA